ncbi:hypothetical protein Taro_046405 [Colocasia esculenta]|uniref:Uncharacterized protein n=1 Tax=Colocasia esculenta TaxID=4460 RepID=A0A843X7D3_COLES|nr:hypothetical protein [Colocasia esculenta]
MRHEGVFLTFTHSLPRSLYARRVIMPGGLRCPAEDERYDKADDPRVQRAPACLVPSTSSVNQGDPDRRRLVIHAKVGAGVGDAGGGRSGKLAAQVFYL